MFVLENTREKHLMKFRVLVYGRLLPLPFPGSLEVIVVWDFLKRTSIVKIRIIMECTENYGKVHVCLTILKIANLVTSFLDGPYKYP